LRLRPQVLQTEREPKLWLYRLELDVAYSLCANGVFSQKYDLRPLHTTVKIPATHSIRPPNRYVDKQFSTLPGLELRPMDYPGSQTYATEISIESRETPAALLGRIVLERISHLGTRFFVSRETSAEPEVLIRRRTGLEEAAEVATSDNPHPRTRQIER
jgi:hypothetical protein